MAERTTEQTKQRNVLRNGVETSTRQKEKTKEHIYEIAWKMRFFLSTINEALRPELKELNNRL